MSQHPLNHRPADEFRHRTPVQTRFNDFDMFGHANNGAYLHYCDVAKLAYFGQFLPEGFDPAASGLVIANINCDFIRQIVPADKVEVLSAVTAIGESSLVLEQLVTSADGTTVHAAVRSVMVQFDACTRRPCPISSEWRSKLAGFEGHDF